MLVPRALAAALAAASFSPIAFAQTPVVETDEETGIQFVTVTDEGDASLTFGIALPPTALEEDADEYIGLLRCASSAADKKGWCGFSHGVSGGMTQSLLLVAWPYEDQVLTSFRYADGYTAPGEYTGNATLTQIRSKVDDTGYEVLYRCQGCFAWDQNGVTGSVGTSKGSIVAGRAQGSTVPGNPECPSDITYEFHDDGFGQSGLALDDAPNEAYEEWAALATNVVTGSCDGGSEPTSTETGGEGPIETETPEPPVECTAVGEDETFDYVVVGGGAGGITVAQRLTEAGNKVVLIEKGPPSLARWGGDMKPEWLEGEELTRFDVPGLCNQVWQDSKGTCTDMDQIAGCVLGGGTAVNAGLWWEPHPLDWDVNFPAGWQSADVADATKRVFERIPGTTHPSMDGELYQQEGYDVLANGLEGAGWERLDDPNASPDKKNQTFGHTVFMYENGERSGPLSTYLVDASENENFSLWTNTVARRLVREGSVVTGVELDACTDASGHTGTIKVASGGRVIVAAGTFGSAKLLLRSGVGPRDQLEIVAGSALDGETFIGEEDWIELPVGENLMDHLNTDVVVEHEDVVQYNYTDAWFNPIEADATAYLQDRTGIFAAAAPNIGPMIWDDISVSDGTSRQLQWTCRMEGSLNLMGNHTITMSQYLGRGVVSRGRMAISPALTTRVADLPYLTGDEGDLEAIIQGLDNIRTALADVPGLKFLSPADNVTSAEYVDQMIVSVSRRSNHWMGTNKIGEDDGRDGGTAVVDLNTQVYGLDNVFVVDGSIMPGMMTGNPSAMIVIMAEHAADKILALEAPAEEPAATEEPVEEPVETAAAE